MPPRSEATRMPRLAALGKPALVAVAALSVLAAVLRLWRLGHQGFWFDEGNTVLLVHLSPGKMLGLIPRNESTPPVYYLAAWIWVHVFGYGEAGLRSLSALAGIATVPVAYGAAAKLVTPRAGMIAAALTACNPLLIWYSQEARSYSLLVLLSGCTLLSFAYARAQPTRRALAAWVLAAVLALATHYYALLVVVPQALWLLAIHRRRRSVQWAITILAAGGAALIPLALSQDDTGRSGWIAPIPLGQRLAQIVPQFLFGFGGPVRVVLERAAELLAVGALALLALRAEPAARRGALAAGTVAFGGLVIDLVLAASGLDDLITRNVIALWLPAAVLIAGGLGSRRAGLAGVAMAGALCAIGLVGSLAVATDRGLQRPDWRAVARVIGPRPSPMTGPRAILVEHYRNLLPLSLYLPGLRFLAPSATATVKELDVVAISAPHEPLCWWGAACNLTPSQIKSDYALAGLRELSRVRTLQFTVVRLVSSTGVPISWQGVGRALTTTTLRRDELLIQP